MACYSRAPSLHLHMLTVGYRVHYTIVGTRMEPCLTCLCRVRPCVCMLTRAVDVFIFTGFLCVAVVAATTRIMLSLTYICTIVCAWGCVVCGCSVGRGPCHVHLDIVRHDVISFSPDFFVSRGFAAQPRACVSKHVYASLHVVRMLVACIDDILEPPTSACMRAYASAFSISPDSFVTCVAVLKPPVGHQWHAHVSVYVGCTVCCVVG